MSTPIVCRWKERRAIAADHADPAGDGQPLTASSQRRRGAEARDGQVVAVTSKSTWGTLRTGRQHASAPLRLRDKAVRRYHRRRRQPCDSRHGTTLQVIRAHREQPTASPQRRRGAEARDGQVVAVTPKGTWGMAPHRPTARLCASASPRQSSSSSPSSPPSPSAARSAIRHNAPGVLCAPRTATCLIAEAQRRRGAGARDGQVVAVTQKARGEWLRTGRQHASAPLRLRDKAVRRYHRRRRAAV